MTKYIIILLTFILIACDREERQFRVAPPYASRVQYITMTPNQAGVATPVPPTVNPYEGNAYALSEGQHLFDNMNCSGCHAHGGGAIGPPLMDEEWIYGSDPANIFATIVEGRPNGMPSFRGKLTDQQVWELVAYVRSLSNMVRKDVQSARNDHMMTSPETQFQTEAKPKQAGEPNTPQ
jgi:cytochrome c oxidase cbb3-type subunit 3